MGAVTGVLMRRWKLVLVGILVLALGAVWWMYRAEIERRVDMALRAGEITQALDQAEADKAALVEARQRNDRLRQRVEEIRADARERIEQAEARFAELRESDEAADRWAGERVPESVRRWVLDATGRDGETRGDSPTANDDPAVPGAGAPGGDQRRDGPDNQAPTRGADELQ